MVVPRELKGLELYEADAKLCDEWPELWAHWRQAFPGMDIMFHVRDAHEWEWRMPKIYRKKNRKRFLTNWLRRSWAKRCRYRSATQEIYSSERQTLIEDMRKRPLVQFAKAEWEVRTFGLQWLSGPRPDTVTRPWDSLTNAELKQILATKQEDTYGNLYWD